ncbi:MAG: STAS domain-containing protein [Bacteroidales bacterium]|nr:STAS domain-containing protein [Bacteroidales bacterium]
MEVNITRENNTITVQFSGRMDTPAAQEITPQMNALAEEASSTIILDCTELTYISSTGLRIFLTLRKAAAEKGGKVIICNICDDIRSVFMMIILKFGYFTNLMKCCRPTHGLPQMPLLGRKLRKAICTPYMGI